MQRKDDVITHILVSNRRRERWLSKCACKNRYGARKDVERETVPDSLNIRPAFTHDTDRIIHSKAYARYIDKTQAFYLFENDHITHRVLHVQFVSKIARTIGRALRLNEDLIEAIALGHDLGHVPYGHDGEKVLDRLCMEHGVGGFAHNVQSVRWLSEIEGKGRGLNLTLQVLDGILAHNGEMVHKEYTPQYDKTWEQFEDEYIKCFADGGYGKKVVPMTLEGCAVRISDVIAYIGRDIEDAITIGLVDRAQIPQSVRDILGDTNRAIIDTLVMDLIRNSFGKDHLEFSAPVFEALSALKDFNYQSIYFCPKVRTEGRKVEHVFDHLFREYLDDIRKKRRSSILFKEFLKDMDSAYTRNNPPARIVADFIAGMTDSFFNNQYKARFVPKSLGYKLKRRSV